MQTEMTTTSILSLFETTKAERQDFVVRVVEALETGAVDPLKVHYNTKCMEAIIKELNANQTYRKSVLEAAGTYGAKSFEFQNSKVEIKETGTKYDFSKCEDPILTSLYQQQTTIGEAVKARETLLKSAPSKGLILTDEQTGETFTAYPPAKSSTTSVAVTLK